MICRLFFPQKSIHGRNSLCNSRTAVQGTAPPWYPSTVERAPKKVGWQVENCFTGSSLRSYSKKVETRLEHILFQRLVGVQMSVWKRSLASLGRLVVRTTLLPLVAPHPSVQPLTVCTVQAVQCGPTKDPQVVPGRTEDRYRGRSADPKGLSSFHLFRHRTAWMVRMLLRLEAAWSKPTYEDGGDAPSTTRAAAASHGTRRQRRVAQQPRHLLWPAAVTEKKPKPCEATAVNAAAATPPASSPAY
jgi:hypothetical protein